MANVMLNSIFWVLLKGQMYFGTQRAQSTTKYTKKRIELRCSFVFSWCPSCYSETIDKGWHYTTGSSL